MTWIVLWCTKIFFHRKKQDLKVFQPHKYLGCAIKDYKSIKFMTIWLGIMIVWQPVLRKLSDDHCVRTNLSQLTTALRGPLCCNCVTISLCDNRCNDQYVTNCVATTVFPHIVATATILFWIHKSLKISYSFLIKFSLM